MEYLPYTEARERFPQVLLQEHEEGERVTFSLEMPEGSPSRVVFGGPAPRDKGAEHLRTVARDKAALPACVDGVLHRMRLSEVGVIPVANWRAVLDLAAFDLATVEEWNEFEAEASMHMNGRDVLLFRPSEYDVLAKIISAVMEHGETDDHDLTLVSIDTPFLMDVRHSGGLTVWCANETVADEVAKVTGAHN